MIVNPKPTADNQDWDGDEADRADRLRFEEEQAMIREQSEARAPPRPPRPPSTPEQPVRLGQACRPCSMPAGP